MKRRARTVFHLIVELVVVISVISTVIVLILSGFARTRKSIEVVAATGEALGTYRIPLSVYYALNGVWPNNTDGMRMLLVPGFKDLHTNLSDNIQIANGAIDIRLGRPLTGQVITLHPTVLAGNPLGQVKWVVSAKQTTEGWSLIGEDHTTVDDAFIPKILKQ